MRSKVPVLVGVGQVVERLEASDYQTKTAIQLACEAVEAALSDAHSEIRGFISAMTVIRTFPDSVPKELQPFWHHLVGPIISQVRSLMNSVSVTSR